MTRSTHRQRVPFRLIVTPCCHTQLCWVNSRLPNHCPECGAAIYAQLKFGGVMVEATAAWLEITEGASVVNQSDKRLRAACREALLFFTAPAHSPRLSPVSRGNLTRMLAEAIGEEPTP